MVSGQKHCFPNGDIKNLTSQLPSEWLKKPPVSKKIENKIFSFTQFTEEVVEMGGFVGMEMFKVKHKKPIFAPAVHRETWKQVSSVFLIFSPRPLPVLVIMVMLVILVIPQTNLLLGFVSCSKAKISTGFIPILKMGFNLQQNLPGAAQSQERPRLAC